MVSKGTGLAVVTVAVVEVPTYTVLESAVKVKLRAVTSTVGVGARGSPPTEAGMVTVMVPPVPGCTAVTGTA